MNGSALIEQKVQAALAEMRGDRFAAVRALEAAIREDRDLIHALAEDAVARWAKAGMREHFTAERERTLAEDDARPMLTTALPQFRSSQAEERIAANLTRRLVGSYAFSLPETSKPLGLALRREVKDAVIAYGRQRRGLAMHEQWLAFVYEACPDEERPIREQIDLDSLTLLRKKAESITANATLATLEPAS